MPNWTYSYVNVKHDKRITKEEFFDKFSIDGKNVSVPFMILGDKQAVVDFKKISRLLKMPKLYHLKDINTHTLGDIVIEKFTLTNALEKNKDDLLGDFAYLIEKELNEDGLSLLKPLETFNTYTPDDIANAIARAFNKRFGHLIGGFEFKQLMDWYETNCEVIGTKWEFELEDFEVDDDEFTFRTATAWNAPNEFLKWISKTFNTTVVATSEDEDPIGMTHNCGWTEEDDEDFDDDKYEEVHYNDPDLCFEHRRGLWFENGKEKYDVVLQSREAEEDFGTSRFKLEEKGENDE